MTMPGDPPLTKTELTQLRDTVDAAHLRALVARREAEALEIEYKRELQRYWESFLQNRDDD